MIYTRSFVVKCLNSISMLINLMLFICKFPDTGGRLNKKDGLTRYGDSHVKDKTS